MTEISSITNGIPSESTLEPVQTLMAAGGDGEHSDFLASLAMQRHFLRFALRGLTTEQAAQQTTVSALCLGGLVKHVSAVERKWVEFIVDGPSALGDFNDWSAEAMQASAEEFSVLDGESVEEILADYDAVAERTEQVITQLPNLDVSHSLPPAPWFQADTQWSARRVLLHIIAETSQHAGHGDIIRESLDGAKTMG